MVLDVVVIVSATGIVTCFGLTFRPYLPSYSFFLPKSVCTMPQALGINLSGYLKLGIPDFNSSKYRAADPSGY